MDMKAPSEVTIPEAAKNHNEVVGIDIRWLFESPLVRLNRWSCRETVTGLTGERHQLWSVIGFVHGGAYELRSPRGYALVDLLQVAFLNPFEAYQTRHPPDGRRPALRHRLL